MSMERKELGTGIVSDRVPVYLRNTDVVNYLQHENVDWTYVDSLKTATSFTDETIAEWLNVNVKTFRSYRLPDNPMKPNVREQVLLLLSLLNQGKAILGSPKNFQQWLETPNFFFDNKAPILLMNTVTGVRLISDRLIAMEFGDNV